MPDESSKLHPALRLVPWHIGDPAVLLESILSHVEQEQARQITAMYLDHVAATMQANLNFIQGVRSVVGGSTRPKGQ